MASTNSNRTGQQGFAGVVGAGGSINAPATGRSRTSNLFGSMLGIFGRPKISPFIESGRRGTGVWGGYVENIEKDRRLQGQLRYKTASDLLANVSIVAAGIRFFLNLVAVPQWSIKPVEDMGDGKSSDEAKKLADFVEDIIDDLDTSWTRIVRRSGMYKFHGFGIQEWTARRREDGFIGMADVESRPQHTIERWELADDGTIIGMWQRWPQNGQLLFLPRQKMVYLVDDLLTDSPEGMGFFRHLVDPAERLRRYLLMEGIGYERDMRGLPVARAPLAEIRKRVELGQLEQEDADKMIAGLQNFVRMQVKEQDTGLLLDSETYVVPSGDGFTVSPVDKWKLELLTGGSTEGFKAVGDAIDRLTHDMARIIGVEQLLIGGHGQAGGSRALSEDKSRNLYLMVDGTVKDIAEAFRRDMISQVWALNGLPSRLMPKMHTEDVAFKDVAAVTKSLSDMATAGAVLSPDDPVINDIRDMMGVSRQPDNSGALAAHVALLPRVTPPKSGMVQPGGGAPEPAPTPKGKQQPAVPAHVDQSPSSTTGPHKPGPTPAAPGNPANPGRRNRTQNSSPGGGVK